MRRLFIAFTALLYSIAVFGQWESANGPPGADRVNELFRSDSGILYAATEGGGIFRSGDNAETWEAVNNGIVSGMVKSVTMNSNGVLFAADSGVIRSFDDGLTWERCNNGIENLAISSVVANNSAMVFAAAYSHEGATAGVYLSGDNGDSWTFREMGVEFSEVITLGMSPQGVLFAGSYGYLKRSSDQGQTWVDLTIDPVNYRINSFDFMNGTILVGAGIEGGVLRSQDNGDTWDFMYAGDITSVAIKNDEQYFAGISPEGVLFSDDAGETWNTYLNGLPLRTINDLHVLGDGTMLAASAGIYRFTGDGSPWTWTSEGMIATAPKWLAANSEGDLFALTERLWRTTDGTEWMDASTGIPSNNLLKVVEMNDTLYVSADSAIYISANNGQDWTMLTAVDTTIADFDVNSSGHLFLMTWDGLLRSTDDGETWTNTGFAGEVMYLTISDVTGTILLSDDYPSLNLYRSADNGATWEMSSPFDIILPVEDFAENEDGDFYIVTTANVLRSEDDGLSWQDISPDVQTQGDNTSIAVDTADRVFLSGEEGLVVSPDGGETWINYIEGIPSWGFIQTMELSTDGFLYGGTNGQGVWRRTAVVSSRQFPVGEKLNIHPNPASGNITISGYKNAGSRIQMLKMTDITGKVIREIPLTGPATTTDISDIPPGVYMFSADNTPCVKVVIH